MEVKDQKSYELVSSSFLAWKMKVYTAPATTPPTMGPAQYTCEHQAHHNFRNLSNLTQFMIYHLITRTTLKMQYSVCKMIKCRITSCIITKSLYTPFQSSVRSTDLVLSTFLALPILCCIIRNTKKQRVLFYQNINIMFSEFS